MRQIKKGSTNISVDIYIIDATDGTPETGVVFDTAGIDLKYRREGEAVVDITEVTLAALTTAHADGGFLEIGNGSYRLDLPDAAVDTGADKVTAFGTITGMIVLPVEIQLVDNIAKDVYDRIGTAGVSLSDLGGMSTGMKGEVTSAVPTVAAIQAEMEENGESLLDMIRDELANAEDGLTALKALIDAIPTTAMRGTDINDLNNISSADVLTQAKAALDTVIPASPTANSVNDVLDRQEESIIAGTASGTPTTTTIISNITITVNDQFNGRIMTFRKDTTTAALRGQQTDITGSTAADNSFTVTALTTAPVSGDLFEIN